MTNTYIKFSYTFYQMNYCTIFNAVVLHNTGTVSIWSTARLNKSMTNNCIENKIGNAISLEGQQSTYYLLITL